MQAFIDPLEDPFQSVRDDPNFKVPEGHVPAIQQVIPGATVTTIEVPAQMDKERGFPTFLHQLAVADGIIVLRPQGEGYWDKDEYLMHAECYSEIYELVGTRPNLVINIAKGRIRSGQMMLPAMSTISLATPNASFGFPEVRVGGLPAITAVALNKRCPLEAQRKMFLMGDPMDASEAQKLGLVDFVGDVEMELARILYQKCTPKEAMVMWKPDVLRALEQQKEEDAAAEE